MWGGGVCGGSRLQVESFDKQLKTARLVGGRCGRCGNSLDRFVVAFGIAVGMACKTTIEAKCTLQGTSRIEYFRCQCLLSGYMAK